MALGVVDRLQELGLDVPRDISVVGFDDVDAARRTTPALTTVRQRALRLGEHAAKLLLDHLLAGDPLGPRRVSVPVRLIVRGSTGPVREDR